MMQERRENCWTINAFRQAIRDGNQCTRRGHSLRMEHRQFNHNKREAGYMGIMGKDADGKRFENSLLMASIFSVKQTEMVRKKCGQFEEREVSVVA